MVVKFLKFIDVPLETPDVGILKVPPLLSVPVI